MLEAGRLWCMTFRAQKSIKRTKTAQTITISSVSFSSAAYVSQYSTVVLTVVRVMIAMYRK